MPWFLFHLGNALATDLTAIQPMSVIGVTGAGLIMLLVNLGVARAFTNRSWKFAAIPAFLLTAYLAWGWWLLPPDDRQDPSFPLAIVRVNIPPEIPWDSTNGNQRVRQLLRAEDSCVATGAHLLVWSESAIPWAWSPDDDLVKELLRHSAQQTTTQAPGTAPTSGSPARQVVHLLGINTAVTAPGRGPASENSTGLLPTGESSPGGATPGENSTGLVRNSVYCLLPDGRVAGRYDKLAPLLFIEQPALGWQFPFFSSDGYSVEPGDNAGPLPTPDGWAGVLICNESALPDAAADRVRQGAQFLVNSSNDGWFRDTWLVAQHFYNARLRAVETRKDLVINSNNGWSGCIYASGRVDTTSRVFMIHPNDEKTIATSYPLLPVYACILSLLGIYFINKKTRML
jgi:apolipoprotein N-acyltransferase